LVEEDAAAVAAARSACDAYIEQAFAMAILCGSVLQVAAKSIECYSTNETVPDSVKSIVGDSRVAKPFCIGREVRGVPIGLVIFAGRNQHIHFNEPSLKPVNKAVFERIAAWPEVEGCKDPALYLNNPLLDSYAANITFILGWRSFEAYSTDMAFLLAS
jgi:hypothetical protein